MFTNADTAIYMIISLLVPSWQPF